MLEKVKYLRKELISCCGDGETSFRRPQSLKFFGCFSNV